MSDKEIRLTFSFTDDFGETITLDKTFNESEDTGKLFWLLDEFKSFLYAYGFSKSMIDNLVYLEKGEKIIDEDGEVIAEYR